MNSAILMFNLNKATKEQLDLYNSSDSIQILGEWYTKVEQTVSYPSEDVVIRLRVDLELSSNKG
jgi:hypothetical protein